MGWQLLSRLAANYSSELAPFKSLLLFGEDVFRLLRGDTETVR